MNKTKPDCFKEVSEDFHLSDILTNKVEREWGIKQKGAVFCFLSSKKLNVYLHITSLPIVIK